ncbi:hypothetical protein ACLOJK_000404 [Asimina triloba]
MLTHQVVYSILKFVTTRTSASIALLKIKNIEVQNKDVKKGTKDYTALHLMKMSKRALMASRNIPIIQDQNLNIHKEVCGTAGVHASKVQQKKGPGIRKALANITNSEKLPLQVPKKNHSTKRTNVGIPLIIEEEQCLHNHQKCIDSQTALTSIQQHHFQKIFGVVDDASKFSSKRVVSEDTYNVQHGKDF